MTFRPQLILPLVAPLLSLSAHARFLQTDPIGTKDDLNLYAYVGNDPIDHTDPSGTFACGGNMDASQCKTFQSAQNSAIKRLERNLAKLNKLADKLASGAKLSRSERALLGRVEKYLGSGSGSAEGVKGLVERGQNILGALKDQTTKVAENQNQSSNADARAGVVAPNAAGERVFQNTVFIMPRFYDNDVSTGERGRQLAHEGDHLENNGIDKAYRQEAGFFGLSPADAANNPDSIVGALGFPGP